MASKALAAEPIAKAAAKPKASDLPSIGGGSGLPSLGGSSLPPVGAGPRGFGTALGGVGLRSGAFEFDPEAKRRAAAELAKLNA